MAKNTKGEDIPPNIEIAIINDERPAALKMVRLHLLVLDLLSLSERSRRGAKRKPTLPTKTK